MICINCKQTITVESIKKMLMDGDPLECPFCGGMQGLYSDEFQTEQGLIRFEVSMQPFMPSLALVCKVLPNKEQILPSGDWIQFDMHSNNSEEFIKNLNAFFNTVNNIKKYYEELYSGYSETDLSQGIKTSYVITNNGIQVEKDYVEPSTDFEDIKYGSIRTEYE